MGVLSTRLLALSSFPFLNKGVLHVNLKLHYERENEGHIGRRFETLSDV
jgi:hypothetical protein